MNNLNNKINTIYDSAIELLNSGDIVDGMDIIVSLFNKYTYDSNLLGFLNNKFLKSNENGVKEIYNQNIELLKGAYDANLLTQLENMMLISPPSFENKLYDKNVDLLSSYPYIFNKNFPKLEENTFVLYTVNDNLAYEYNKYDSSFEKIEINSTQETKYFFQDLKNPLFVENEFNQFNLNFLVDNVRASEDVAYENHIYLHYENIRTFSKLLQYCDLEPLLKDQKFVFLFDDEKLMYPIDFKEKFNIDYTTMEFQEVRPEEIKRLIVQTGPVSSAGNAFFPEVLDWHPDILTMEFMESGFGVYNKDFSVKKYIKIISETINSNKTDDEKVDYLRTTFCGYNLLREGLGLDFETFKDYFIRFEEICNKYNVESLKDWLSASYLAISKLYNKDFSSRISPTIHHIVHTVIVHNRDIRAYGSDQAYQECIPIFESFSYYYSFTPIRDPISMVASNLKQQIKIHFKESYNFNFILFFFMNFDFNGCNRPTITHKIENRRFIRFEDIKMNPKATLKAMCNFFNLEYSEILGSCTKFGQNMYGGKSISRVLKIYFDNTKANSIVDGYSVFSVYDENLNGETFSEFDIKRLELAFYPVYELLGYCPQEHDYTEYTDQEIFQMFATPFEFEKQIIDMYPSDKMLNVETNNGIQSLDLLRYNDCCRSVIANKIISYRKMVKQQLENNLLNTYSVLQPDERFLVNPLYTNVKSLPILDDTNVSFLID